MPKIAVAVISGLAITTVAVTVALRSPAFAWASTPAFLLAEVVLLALAIIVAVVDHRRGVSWIFCGSVVLAAASWSWVEWGSPAASNSLVFTIGQMTAFAVGAFLALACENYPSQRRGRFLATILATSGAIVLGGFVPALMTNPAAQGCPTCPTNLVTIAVAPELANLVTMTSLGIAAVLVLASVAVLIHEATRMSAARRRVLLPVLAPACAGLGLVAANLAVSARLGHVGSGSEAVRLWEWTGAAVLLTLVGAASAWMRGRRQRHAVARLVADIVATDAAGNLRDALAADLDEPLLDISYPISPGGPWVDAEGRETRPAKDSVLIVANGETVASVSHAPRLADDPSVAHAVARGAMLALDREGLQAQTRWRRREIQASCARVVEVGDAERRRLERNLHDGAQQRLAALSLELRLRRDSSPLSGSQIDAAGDDVRQALTSLREIAHGIYPASLAEEGLSAALETLTEMSPTPVRLLTSPPDDLRGPGATAAYFCSAEATREATDASIAATASNGLITLIVRGAAVTPEAAQAMTDRVLALDGNIRFVDDEVHVEVVCG